MHELRTIASKGGGEVEMGFIRPVEAGIAIMSRAPKTSCPRDPRAQTHTQIVRAYLRCVCAGKQASAYTQPSRDRGKGTYIALTR